MLNKDALLLLLQLQLLDIITQIHTVDILWGHNRCYYCYIDPLDSDAGLCVCGRMEREDAQNYNYWKIWSSPIIWF